MPEYPDIETYVSALRERAVGSSLKSWHFLHPFLLRTVEPSPESFLDRELVAVNRLGKRIVFAFADELYAAIHLMIAGRLQWKDAGPPATDGGEGDSAGGRTEAALLRETIRRPGGRSGGPLFLARFSTGTLTLTEAGTRRRASIHLVAGTG
ncbi:DNA-formamidopyrimidine glycosylase family protein, partial [Salinispira pacifica]